jgi:3-oxoacyl-[acyl-carrier protein] reductase
MITADLTGKRALVTGAASGIGMAAAEKLARAGASVAINDLAGNPRLEETVARLAGDGLKVLAAPGNIGDADDARRMTRDAIAALGGLDYLVNNGATPGTKQPIPPADFQRQDEAFWNRLLNVNVLGAFRSVEIAAPHLKKSKGAIVSTASNSAFYGGGSSSPYCATKAAIVTLTREWARALAPDVRVNAVAPGWVEGSNWECKWTEDERSDTSKLIPLGRPGHITEYAEAIFFLLAGGSYINAQTILVDGGMMS